MSMNHLTNEYKGLGGPLPPDATTKRFIHDIYKLLYRRAGSRVRQDKIAYHAAFIACSWDQTILHDRELSRP